MHTTQQRLKILRELDMSRVYRILGALRNQEVKQLHSSFDDS